MHTNTIEGFWSIVKNSIKGNYIALSKKYLPFYLVQAQYIYNNRNYSGDLFARFLKEALVHDNPMEIISLLNQSKRLFIRRLINSIFVKKEKLINLVPNVIQIKYL